MSYVIPRHSRRRQGGLLFLVMAAHLGLALILLAAKTVVPPVAELPLMADLLQAPSPVPLNRQLPVVKPSPFPEKTTPRPSLPLEASRSSLAADNAPVAAPHESKAAPAAAPATETISQPRFDADYLNNPAPAYPPLSRRAGEEGKVILRVSVSPQGSAEGVEIKTSSGSPRLDESAQKTVRTWKFIPAKRGDSAIQSWVLVPIIFKLEK